MFFFWVLLKSILLLIFERVLSKHGSWFIYIRNTWELCNLALEMGLRNLPQSNQSQLNKWFFSRGKFQTIGLEVGSFSNNFKNHPFLHLYIIEVIWVNPLIFSKSPINSRTEIASVRAVHGVYLQSVHQGWGEPVSVNTEPEAQPWP